MAEADEVDCVVDEGACVGDEIEGAEVCDGDGCGVVFDVETESERGAVGGIADGGDGEVFVAERDAVEGAGAHSYMFEDDLIGGGVGCCCEGHHSECENCAEVKAD